MNSDGLNFLIGTDVQARLSKRPVDTGITRILDTPFVIDTDNPSDVRYNLEISAKSILLGFSSASVALLLNGVQVDEAFVRNEQLLGLVDVGTKVTQRQSVAAFVHAGVTVTLSSTLVGTATATIISCREVVYV